MTDSEKVLVVGDWLVDEYWLLGEQRSMFSRRRGLSHMLALNPPEASIRLLGGAGLAATILAQMKISHPPSSNEGKAHSIDAFTIHGVGKWHRHDGAAIRHLMNASEHNQQTHHRLSFPENNADKLDVKIHNVHRRPRDNAKDDGATTRIIRHFHRAGDRLELSQRVDWEVTTNRHDGELMAENLEKEKKIPDGIRHIVVLDLEKGVISVPMIEVMEKRFPEAAWYVFSKSFQPEWLAKCSPSVRNRIRLLFIPSTAANAAMNASEDWSSSTWITDKKIPSQDAINALKSLNNDYPFANVVVAPAGMSLLVGPAAKNWRREDETAAVSAAKQYRTKTEETSAFVQADPKLCEFGELIPMSTVLFPSLVGHFVAFGKKATDPLQNLVERSLSFTNHWMVSEAARFREETFSPNRQQICQIQFLSEQVAQKNGAKTRTNHCDQDDGCKLVERFRSLKEFSLDAEERKWQQAFQRRGIIDVTGSSDVVAEKKEFQLWRSTIDVSRYVTCVPVKRRVLQQLVGLAKAFKSQAHRQHKSVYLKDDPGSGKSFLVERLAEDVGIRRVEFNITQMQTRADLLHCFDTIVTTQAQSPRDPLLIFFDEINAHLEGGSVYDSFLAPLEQGIYVRSGHRFHIQPCLWVFAGTEFPNADNDVEHDRSQKASDFVSRLSREPFDLSGPSPHCLEERSGNKADELKTLERIYVAIATLRTEFPDVTEVSHPVFEIFESLNNDMGPRAIRQLIRTFQDIQRGQVTVRNLPNGWWKKTSFKEHQAREFVNRYRDSLPDFVRIEV